MLAAQVPFPFLYVMCISEEEGRKEHCRNIEVSCTRKHEHERAVRFSVAKDGKVLKLEQGQKIAR